jgi:hypothetical protein
MRTLRLGPFAAAFALAIPCAGAHAQERVRTHAVELTLSAGAFVPTGTTGLAGGTSLTRRGAWLGSTHLTFNAPNGRLSGEFEIGLTPERIRQTSGAFAGSRHSNLWYGTAKVLVGRNPRRSGITYMVGGGLSYIYRRKSVLDPNVSKGVLGGAAAAHIRIPIDGQVGARLEAEDLIYSADFGLGKKVRNDFAITIGLSIAY